MPMFLVHAKAFNSKVCCRELVCESVYLTTRKSHSSLLSPCATAAQYNIGCRSVTILIKYKLKAWTSMYCKSKCYQLLPRSDNYMIWIREFTYEHLKHVRVNIWVRHPCRHQLWSRWNAQLIVKCTCPVHELCSEQRYYWTFIRHCFPSNRWQWISD